MRWFEAYKIGQAVEIDVCGQWLRGEVVGRTRLGMLRVKTQHLLGHMVIDRKRDIRPVQAELIR